MLNNFLHHRYSEPSHPHMVLSLYSTLPYFSTFNVVCLYNPQLFFFLLLSLLTLPFSHSVHQKKSSNTLMFLMYHTYSYPFLCPFGQLVFCSLSNKIKKSASAVVLSIIFLQETKDALNPCLGLESVSRFV